MNPVKEVHVRVKSTQSCPTLCDPWTVACQAPLSMGFSRQKYWSGLLCSSSGECSEPRDRTHISCVSCIGRRVFYYQYHLGSPVKEDVKGIWEVIYMEDNTIQSWIFIGRTDTEAKTPIVWPPDVKNWLIVEDPDAGKDWKQEEKGMTEDAMGWMASPTWWTWVWVSFRRWWWTGKPGVLQSVGSQRVGHNWATELNWFMEESGSI